MRKVLALMLWSGCALAQWSDFSAYTAASNLYNAMNGKRNVQVSAGACNTLAGTAGKDVCWDSTNSAFYDATVNGSPATWVKRVNFSAAGVWAALSGTAPIVFNSGTGAFSCQTATDSLPGCVSAADHAAFNAKQAALGFTPLNAANNLSDVTAATARTNLGLGSFAVLNNPMTAAGDFLVAGAGGAPLRLTAPGNGTFCPSWSAGVVTWITCPGAGGGISSVGLTVPAWLTVSGSPLTTNGTLAVTAQTGQASHQVIGTCGSATTFGPCALVAGDIPTLPYQAPITAGTQDQVITGAFGLLSLADCTAAGGMMQYSVTTHTVTCHTLAVGDLPADLGIAGTLSTGVGSGNAGVVAVSQGAAPTFGTGTGAVPTAGYVGEAGPAGGVMVSYLLAPPIALPGPNQFRVTAGLGANGRDQNVWQTWSASAVIGLWGGTCNSSTALGGAGNCLAVMTNPMTTAGDLAYGGTGGAPTRLPAATGYLHWTGSTFQYDTPSGSGATIPSTTNLISGDGAGNGADSTIVPADVALLSGAQTITGDKTYTGKIEHSGATHTLPAKTGTAASKPGTCTVGEEYFATDSTAGQNKWYCTVSNTWTQQPGAATHTIAFVVDGGGSAIVAGASYVGQLPAGCSITGWSLVADQTGSISIDLDAHANASQATAPAIPNTSTDKISASAPMALASAQSAASTTLTGWTTSRAIWDSFAINITSATTVTKVTGQVFCQ
jgi:hypothetical protein